MKISSYSLTPPSATAVLLTTQYQQRRRFSFHYYSIHQSLLSYAKTTTLAESKLMLICKSDHPSTKSSKGSGVTSPLAADHCTMMHPSQLPPKRTAHPSSNTPTSIYDAIKCDDWEGLLTLYATTVYDAVHSAEFSQLVNGNSSDGASDGSVGTSAPFMPVLENSPRKEGFFRDGKHNELVLMLTHEDQVNNMKLM